MLATQKIKISEKKKKFDTYMYANGEIAKKLLKKKLFKISPNFFLYLNCKFNQSTLGFSTSVIN